MTNEQLNVIIEAIARSTEFDERGRSAQGVYVRELKKTDEQRIIDITSSLKTCIRHFRYNQIMPPIEEDASPDCRAGYRQAMNHAEAVIGTLMFEQGIDLRGVFDD